MLAFKDPEDTLSKADLEELLDENKEFDSWLKREKKISNYANARGDRKKRREVLRRLVDKVGSPRTLKRIAEQIEYALNTDSHFTTDVLQDIAEFFQNLGVRVGAIEPALPDQEVGMPSPSEPAVIPEVTSETQPKIIGRVAPTLHTPTTPTEFSFWVEDKEDIHIETGSLVTARNLAGIRVTGLVSEVQAMSDLEGMLDSFYSHAFGRPDKEMPTKLPIIMSAKVEVIRRSDGRTEPIRGAWPVTFATASEIREAYGSDISSEYEILAGFTYDDQHNPVPIGIDARYTVGYEAAHINISGASGIATKTSYALFLLYSLLAHNYQNQGEGGGSIAAIAFNVKEADLMFIDELPRDWSELKKWESHARLGDSIKLWQQAKDDYCIDPIKWAAEKKFKFFAPMRFDFKGGVLSQRRENITSFTYSLKTLANSGVGSLYALFDPADLDEKAQALIASMAEVARNGDYTFDSLMSEVRKRINVSKNGDWFTFGESLHHRATANKILGRMKHAIDNQLRGVILSSENTDQPMLVEQIKPGELWVIDITQLSDKGQRLVFQTIVRTIFKTLEERKSQELTGSLQGDLAQFPKLFIIFVDELNKFVPAGREFSALKDEIVEMAARGRSVGLALCGAEQLASKVDEEVLANTSTFAVGRSHAVEIRKPPYAWLAEGLKQKAMVLDKGWILLWHSLHKRPVLVHFPLPLHKIYEELKKGR